MKRIILCADDYGQNSFISQSIIKLFESNRLSATSCLATSYYFQTHSQWLKPFLNQVDIGLHFNLTEGEPASRLFKKKYGLKFMPLKQLILNAYTGRLDKNSVETEFYTQLEQFVAAFGQLPDFIDGHQHIHQFPIIRDVIFALYEDKLKDSGAYVRSLHDDQAIFKLKAPAFFKRIFLQFFGAKYFKKALLAQSIPHNLDFDGMYSFSPARAYAKLFPIFLKSIKNHGLIMCHPGLKADLSSQDTISEARYLEFQYFMSEQFIDDCQKNDVILARFRDVSA